MLTVGGPRVAAPPLQTGGGWLGIPLDITRDLRGRIVLLWFFSGSSADSMLMAEELRGVQRQFADVLTVIGIHVPGFAHERRPRATQDAVGRLRLTHPVLDDHELVNWDTFAVRATPTMILLDPRGRIAGEAEGPGHGAELSRAIQALVEEDAAEHLLQRDAEATQDLIDRDLDVSPLAGDGELACPSGVAAHVESGEVRLLAVADTGHDRVVLCSPDGQVLRVLDGFYQPHGLAFERADSLLVCDTARHCVWRVDVLSAGRTLVTDRVLAPTDVVLWRDLIVVAGAAENTLVGVDDAGTTVLLAGSGRAGRDDGGALTTATLAQPRALAVTSAGELAFLDARSCALRVLDRPGGTVRTLVGKGPAGSGHQDGGPTTARMQYPLGLAADGDTLFVADTFNGRLRTWRSGELSTIALATFAEPAALAALGDGRLLVADRSRHCVAIVESATAQVESWNVGRVGADTPTHHAVPTVILGAGDTLEVQTDLDLGGDVLDEAGEAPIRVRVVAAAEWLLGEQREWALSELPVQISIPMRHGSGRVVVEIRSACRDGDIARERRTARPFDVVVT